MRPSLEYIICTDGSKLVDSVQGREYTQKTSNCLSACQTTVGLFIALLLQKHFRSSRVLRCHSETYADIYSGSQVAIKSLAGETPKLTWLCASPCVLCGCRGIVKLLVTILMPTSWLSTPASWECFTTASAEVAIMRRRSKIFRTSSVTARLLPGEKGAISVLSYFMTGPN